MDVNELLNTVKKSPRKVQAKPKKHDQSFNNVMDSISQNWNINDKSNDLTMLKRELEKAQEKIQLLESFNNTLSKNEEKIINAIRSESIEQNTNKPIISYNKFRKKHKVSSNYYRPSIEKLLNKGIIEKEEACFSGKVKTFKLTIVGNQKN